MIPAKRNEPAGQISMNDLGIRNLHSRAIKAL